MVGDNIDDLLEDKTQLIFMIDRLISDLLGETNSLPRAASPFDCKVMPSISVHDYLVRICKYSHCSPCVFVAALIYIDRFQERIQNFIINYYNIHRLFITCIMIGAKFWDDFYYKNQFYAKIGGVGKELINTLQLEILTTFDFGLFIGEEEFKSYLTRIRNYREVSH